jgi:glycosyltransferase involved in cell wall biosynthesis
MPYRLAIFETHPIQYKVPWFRALAAHPEIELTVFYCMLPDARQQGVGFGVTFQWDVPLLEGYRHVLLDNVAKQPGVTHLRGCDTPSIRRMVGAPGLGVPAFDAVIINGWVVKGCLQALWACRRAGVPAILRCEACDLQPRVWWKTLVHRALLRQFSAFMAIGAANRQFYLRRGVSPARIVDGLYCVENARFAGSCPRTTRSTQRQAWGIRGDAVCFLFCGKFETKKRPLDLLQALEVLGRTSRRPALAAAPASGLRPPTSDVRCPPSGHPPLHLLLVGDGELRAACESFARERRLPVTFAGFLNQGEMPAAYAVADCLILPSDHGETWGLVVNEAMACGLPAITSDRVGCHPDLIIPGLTGAVFPCGDSAALAEAMGRLAADPERLAVMGQAAREHVKAYSIDALLEGTLAALRLACGR